MAIEIRGLSKAFDGKPVLRDFSCTVEEGAVTCIMGPSGVGKTTLLNILLGLLPPDAGDCGTLPGLRCSAVFQEDRLCENLSAVDNVRVVTGNAVSRAQITQALDAIGLEGSGRQPVRELSGGMRRRVAIVRALLAAYDVLILDEPFKGLDAKTKARTIAYLKAQAQGRTVIMITHDAQEAALMCGATIHMAEMA